MCVGLKKNAIVLALILCLCSSRRKLQWRLGLCYRTDSHLNNDVPNLICSTPELNFSWDVTKILYKILPGARKTRDIRFRVNVRLDWEINLGIIPIKYFFNLQSACNRKGHFFSPVLNFWSRKQSFLEICIVQRSPIHYVCTNHMVKSVNSRKELDFDWTSSIGSSGLKILYWLYFASYIRPLKLLQGLMQTSWIHYLETLWNSNAFELLTHFGFEDEWNAQQLIFY